MKKQTEPKIACIYAMVDPRDERIHYIGQTANYEQRKKSHVDMFSSTDAFATWRLDLKAHKLKPRFMILEICGEHKLNEQESYWAWFGINSGWPLTNSLKNIGNCGIRPFLPP